MKTQYQITVSSDELDYIIEALKEENARFYTEEYAQLIEKLDNGDNVRIITK